MKNIFLSLLGFLLVSIAMAQQGTTSSPEAENGTVFFMRYSNIPGNAGPYTVFVDDILACRLGDNSYSAQLIAPGTHRFSVQFAGKKAIEKAKRLEIEIEVGKKYYFQLITEMRMFKGTVYCREITEEAALQVFNRVELTEGCR